MSTALKRRNRPRRGVTLVEMLVVVALVVLMMVILVQIFQSALGAMSVSRTTQELDVVLRSIDSIIRSDLNGVTAKMTPPNDPVLKQGYFEYIENAPADLQGEDADDIIAFTTKAPEGQVFTGRQWLSDYVIPPTGGNAIQKTYQAIQPTTVTSQVAEVIYFLRNGNLYRRVFLVAPERQSSISSTFNTFKTNNGQNCYFPAPIFGGSLSVSWLGMNDISCRPGGVVAVTSAGNTSDPALAPIANDLGDLTNRENRAFRPRFANDFHYSNNQFQPDGIPDDLNADGVPDYYPTVYTDGSNSHNGRPNGQIYDLGYYNNTPGVWINPGSYDIYAFPFIYPGMYSVPDPNRLPGGALNLSKPQTNLGWVHYLPPSIQVLPSSTNNQPSGFLNHSPLDLGDTPAFAPGGVQTWWGFPTWHETMTGTANASGGWRDPISNLALNSGVQPLGLKPFPPATAPSPADARFLPPVTNYGTTTTPFGYDPAAGSTSFIANPNAPTTVWQDELILTNVRSFDVKAYDPNAPLYSQNVGTPLSSGYWDLGYAGLLPSTFAPNYAANSTIYGPNGSNFNINNQIGPPTVMFQAIGGEPIGFGHEGRIPPLPGDFRYHPRRPADNLGDPGPGVIRLVHTFDTWSTAYTNAPDSDILLNGYSTTSLPIYPSFPAPYPSPLRGIQIQIRVTDPRNERTKVLTIRQDFTDKL